MRIAVLTDAHANEPALRAALEAIRGDGCEAIYHLGDAIAIGPQPAECVALLVAAGVRCLMGNHESYVVHGLPRPRPAWLSDGEIEHQQWTLAQLDPALRQAMAGWPFVVKLDGEGVRLALLHYALDDSGRDFKPSVRGASAADLDQLFEGLAADVVFYGHDHRAADQQGRARYVNPGSLGCHTLPVARYCLVDCERGECRVEQRAVAYDDGPLWRAFDERRVPERHFLYRAFFGGRWPG